jgi:hypothetical protein
VAASRIDTRDADLAELVRSAAAPGLKERISRYLAAPAAATAAIGRGPISKETQ